MRANYAILDLAAAMAKTRGKLLLGITPARAETVSRLGEAPTFASDSIPHLIQVRS